MKKFLFTAVLLLSFSFSQAQFHLGIMAGYNSSLNLNNFTTTKYTFDNVLSEMGNNFHGGIFARVPLGKAVYIEPELLYSIVNKNYTVTLTDLINKDVTYNKFVSINSVDIPVLVGIKLLDLKVLNVRAFAGPKFRLSTNNSVLNIDNLTKPSGSNSSITIDEIKKEFQESKIGLDVGAGIDVLMFSLDFRCNLFSDMYNAKINDYNSNTFVVSLGWKIF